MPVSVKGLHLAKCMSDLEKLAISDVKCKTFSIPRLMKSSHKVFEAAEKSNLDMDEEHAYVLYMRFISLVLLLKSKPGFEKQGSDSKAILKNVNTALCKADKLKNSLLKRYSVLAEVDCRSENEKNIIITALHSSSSDIIVPPKVDSVSASTISNNKSEIEASITCAKLHSLLFENSIRSSNILLVDARSSGDFEESHVKHESCINVPQEYLLPGTIAAKLESYLDPRFLAKWYMREEADHVILFDWDSKNNTALSQPMTVLINAITKWDPKTTLKNPPIVLEGGYKEWMRRYPMFTTQVLRVNYTDSPKTSPVIADVSGIEYPNLDETDRPLHSNKNKSDEPEMLFQKRNHNPLIPQGTPESDSRVARSTKSAPVVDRKSKPGVHRSLKSSAGDRKNLNSATISTNSNSNHRLIPDVINNLHDSKNKNQERANHRDELLDKEKSIASERLAITNKQVAKEEELSRVQLQKCLEAEESKLLEIQKQEELLKVEIKRLENEANKSHANLQQVKEENEKLKKKIEQISDEKTKAKEQELKQIEAACQSRQEFVEQIREERKKQELAKKLQPRKADVIPRDIVSANSGLKRNIKKQDSNSSQNSTEYLMPLSRESSTDSSSRGLVRSYSSPNIAQMLNQEGTPQNKIPMIDRALKPKVPTTNYQMNETVIMNRNLTTRNLNPVHGTSPVRPATGLRNLGNTCFMNSIIQCLSNTVLLAHYFESGRYMSDLNRDARSNGEVAEEFAIVIRALWMGQYKSISPRDFKNTVSKCLSVCLGNEQQDSHEFLVVLMEKLHADLNKRFTRPIPKLDPNADEFAFWDHHKRYNSSAISDIFEGLLKSTLTCLCCGTTSDSFEVFSCLSLPILTSKCTLRDCLQLFMKSEKISGEAAWDCPKCKQKKEAEKCLRITQLPEVLIIQLKRFSFEGWYRRKLQTAVEFDFNLDVPFEKNSSSCQRKYSLYGIVNHFGTLEGGHYTAFCKSSKKWFKYDDHEVSEINYSDVRSPAAYILFYQSTEMRSNL